MKFKLFGKELFEVSGAKSELILQPAYNQIKESKYLPDFHTAGRNDSWEISQFVEVSSAITAISTNNTNASDVAKKKEEKPKETEKPSRKPKEVYDLRFLHDDAFKLNVDKSYVEEQLEDFKEKLALIKSEEYDMRRGTEEIASIVVRLENRLKYNDFHEFFDQFPYTMTSKIDAVLKDHSNLQLGQVAQFVADMPREATKAMKEYNSNTKALCDKQAVFYIIADKKDFKKSSSRRDPILLAQSPFGHVWQILGAWDEEMLFLEQL